MSELLCLACRLTKGYQVVLGAGLAETAFGWSHSALSCGKEMRKRWWVTAPGAGLSLSPTLGSHKPGATEFDQGLCTAELEYSQVCPSPQTHAFYVPMTQAECSCASGGTEAGLL